MSENAMLNPNFKLSKLQIGQEKNIVIIVDDFLMTPTSLQHAALDENSFIDEEENYYPGIRKDVPRDYLDLVSDFCRDQIFTALGLKTTAACESIQSKFCIVTKRASELSPIQSIPHFDTSDENQLAAVHYLCSPPFNGTSFYRHKSSGFESITPERSKRYFKHLNREAATFGLPKSGYVNGDTALYKQVASVECAFNRIVFYKSNLLHAGNIDASLDLRSDPRQGRLTANSFIKLQS